VEAVGVAEGVTMGGVLQVVLREATVQALPLSMPDRLEIDVSALNIGDGLRVEDLVVPEGATVLDEPETVVVTVIAPRVEVEEAAEVPEGEEVPAEEAGAEEGEPAADAEAPSE
jgi:large subunit ribosomal protein L25